MITRIDSPALPVQPLEAPSRTTETAPFGDFLSNAIAGVEQSGAEARKAAEGFLADGTGDVHSVALASQRAGLQFEYFLQVRNKLVQAYQETMRMQL
jgi:flagellar hook-basal body complex protein FliE